MEVYIGLDVHCKRTFFVAQDQKGKCIAEGIIPTHVDGFDSMLKKIGVPQGTRIGLETGTQATWVSRILTGFGMKPVVIDATEVRKKARRVGQKSDRRDAFEICDGLRRDIYTSIVYVPDESIQQLRHILSRRRHFVRLSTSQVNAAKFLLRSVGLQKEATKLTTWTAWEKLLTRPSIDSLCRHLAMHAAIWRKAQKMIEILEKELADAMKPFQETEQLLRTAPAVGPITAATFIATLGTPERFPSCKHVSSYLGLAVSTYNSGDKEAHGRITKRGSNEMRALLCQVAQHAAKPDHPLHPYFIRICARSGYKKAVVAVAHRLARILFQMWRKQERFDPSYLNVTYEKKYRKKTVFWHIKKPAKQEALA